MDNNNELLINIEDSIATLTLNRPEKKNSLSVNILNRLEEFFSNPPDDVRVVVIRGIGDEAFSSGFDISTIGNSAPGSEGKIIERTYSAIRNSKLPTIAYLNGYAMGAACDLTTNCDIRIANPKGKFGMPPAKLGVIYSHAGLGRFISIVGLANTKEMFLTGRIYPAEKCYEMGLLNSIIDQDKQEEAVYKMAREIVSNAPLSVQGIKQMLVIHSQQDELSPAVQKEVDAITTKVYESDDLKEGKSAFLEKRKPEFKGR